MDVDAELEALWMFVTLGLIEAAQPGLMAMACLQAGLSPKDMADPEVIEFAQTQAAERLKGLLEKMEASVPRARKATLLLSDFQERVSARAEGRPSNLRLAKGKEQARAILRQLDDKDSEPAQ